MNWSREEAVERAMLFHGGGKELRVWCDERWHDGRHTSARKTIFCD